MKLPLFLRAGGGILMPSVGHDRYEKGGSYMSDLKKILRDVGYFGVGAAAVIVDAGGKAIKALVRKGEETLRDNQDTVDELKRKARDLGEKVKDAAQKAAAKPEPTPVDAAAMTPEERAELRRQLDEADAQPVAPDAVYRTEEPVPAEDAAVEAPPADDPAEDEPKETFE